MACVLFKNSFIFMWIWVMGELVFAATKNRDRGCGEKGLDDELDTIPLPRLLDQESSVWEKQNFLLDFGVHI